MGKMILAVATPVWFATWITLACLENMIGFAIVVLSPMVAIILVLFFATCYDYFLEGYREFKNK